MDLGTRCHVGLCDSAASGAGNACGLHRACDGLDWLETQGWVSRGALACRGGFTADGAAAGAVDDSQCANVPCVSAACSRYANDPGESNPYGFQRWYRTWAIDFASTETIYWNYEGDEIQLDDLPGRAFDSTAERDATGQLFADYNERTTSTPALDQRFNSLAVTRIDAHPLRYYVVLPVARVLNMIFRPRAEAFPLPLDWWSFTQHWGR